MKAESVLNVHPIEFIPVSQRYLQQIEGVLSPFPSNILPVCRRIFPIYSISSIIFSLLVRFVTRPRLIKSSGKYNHRMKKNNQGKKTKVLGIMLLLLAIISIASITGMAQFEPAPGKKPVPDIRDSVELNYPRLLKEFGNNKEMPHALEKQILYALSYYPELAQTKIKFELVKSTGGMISTRPFISSLLRQSSKRSYLVIIYDSTEGRTFPVFSQADINGQVGILGHELSHIIYFSHCTGLGLLGLGVAHISTSYIDRWEYHTDSMDIERGLGYQLIAWNEFLHKGFQSRHPTDQQSAPHPAYKKRYMNVEDIKRVMSRSKLYTSATK